LASSLRLQHQSETRNFSALLRRLTWQAAAGHRHREQLSRSWPWQKLPDDFYE